MKIYSLTLIFFLTLSQVCYSQSKKEYNVYLVFNSNNKEVNVVERKVNDSVLIKTFSFSKDLTVENFEYELSVDDNGKINKDSNRVPISKKGKITLYHYSYIHKEETINDIPEDNIIDYKDFVNAEFKSFNKVLRKATKIYMIDIKNNGKSGYKALEVRL